MTEQTQHSTPGGTTGHAAHPAPRQLNIIGGGKLGRTLGRLWTRAGVFAVQDILNRSTASGAGAAAFIEAGQAASSFASLRPADLTLIATADDQIAATCAQLAAAGILRAGDIVFHCSGALPASRLDAARACGALVASVHPLASFADPAQLADHFAGIWCTLEGDDAAVAVLRAAFEQVGALTLRIDSQAKLLYHAAAVFASNYVVTVLGAATRTAAHAGIDQASALRLFGPMVQECLQNVLRQGAADALSGPVKRGDYELVRAQAGALDTVDVNLATLYRQLANATATMVGRPPAFD